MKNYKYKCFYVKLNNEEPKIVIASSMKQVVDSYGDNKIESINCIEKSVNAPEGIFK